MRMAVSLINSSVWASTTGIRVLFSNFVKQRYGSFLNREIYFDIFAKIKGRCADADKKMAVEPMPLKQVG
jgi:hypothetical protein